MKNASSSAGLGSPAPICLYLFWHERCEEAEQLASELWRWLRAPTKDILAEGLGVPVYYRVDPRSAHLRSQSCPHGIQLEQAKTWLHHLLTNIW